MPLVRLIAGDELPKGAALGPESQAANAHIRDYLKGNVEASQTLLSMSDPIRAFSSNAPRIFVSKCIDGRVHGSNGKGYPPTTVTFSRTEGNNVALTPENTHFWNRLHAVILDAQRHTPGCPALFIALGHHSHMGHGCAAHNEDDAAALQAVVQQASMLRKKYTPTQLYVIAGMTNTDDGAERMLFEGGQEIDTAAIIERFDTKTMPLKRATDIFQDTFLDHVIDDMQTYRCIGSTPLRAIIDGPKAPMFSDLQTMIAMETYLLRDISMVIRNESRTNVIFQPRLFEYVQSLLETVKNLPEALKAPLMYQVLWNIAYTLHQRERLQSLPQSESAMEVEHAENKVAYGDGFEIEKRNVLVLAKPGRGDDQIALTVARKVLLNNRKNYHQPFPPIVHVNVEVAGELGSWEAFNRNVLAPLMTRLDNVHSVFGDDCRVLTTYSRSDEKCFYPVRINQDVHVTGIEDARESYPFDITRGLNIGTFTRQELAVREHLYKQMMVVEAL